MSIYIAQEKKEAQRQLSIQLPLQDICTENNEYVGY
jgi:hypothetical protein